MSYYKNIIIVGTNNTSRSFMAEAVLQQLFREKGMEEVEVISRGLVVLFPEPVHPMAAKVVAEAGYVIRDFSASKLSGEEVEEADLLITITPEEKERLLTEFADELGEEKKVVTLSELAGEKGGVPNPYGKEKEDYACCLVTIRRMLESSFANICGKESGENV